MRWLIALTMLAACAAPSRGPSPVDRLDTRINADIPKGSVRAVVGNIAEQAGVRVIVDDDVSGEVPIIVKNVPFSKVMDGICKTMNLMWYPLDATTYRLSKARTY